MWERFIDYSLNKASPQLITSCSNSPQTALQHFSHLILSGLCISLPLSPIYLSILLLFSHYQSFHLSLSIISPPCKWRSTALPYPISESLRVPSQIIVTSLTDYDHRHHFGEKATSAWVSFHFSVSFFMYMVSKVEIVPHLKHLKYLHQLALFNKCVFIAIWHKITVSPESIFVAFELNYNMKIWSSFIPVSISPFLHLLTGFVSLTFVTPVVSSLIHRPDKCYRAALIGADSDRVNSAPSSDPLQAVNQTRWLLDESYGPLRKEQRVRIWDTH